MSASSPPPPPVVIRMVPLDLTDSTPPAPTVTPVGAVVSASSTASRRQPKPITDRSQCLPNRFYAYHTHHQLRPTTRFIDSVASLQLARRDRQQGQLLASFDAEYSSSDEESDEETTSSSDDATSEEEEERKSGSSQKASQAAMRQLVQKRAVTAAASTVTPKAGVAAAAAASTTSSVSSPSMILEPYRTLAAQQAQPAREKIARLLTSQLNALVAPLIERALWDRHNGVMTAYSSHARELMSNLRVLQSDSTPESSAIVRNIHHGKITAQQLVLMTPAQLAPIALQAQRQAEAKEILKTTLVRQVSGKETQSTNILMREHTQRDRARDEAATAGLDAAISLPSRIPIIDLVSPRCITSANSSTPHTPTGAASTPKGRSEADLIIQKFATPPKLTHPSASDSISDTDDSSDDELLIASMANRKAPTTSSQPTRKSAASNGTAKPHASASKVQSKSSAKSNGSTSPSKSSDSLKRKSMDSTVNVNATSPHAQSVTPHDNTNHAAKRTKLDDASELRHDAPTPPPLEAASTFAPSLLIPPPLQVHATDPIRLTPLGNAPLNIASYTGLISFAFPRRGELPLTFHVLPTSRDIFSPAAHSQPPKPTPKHDRNAWNHILPNDLNEPHKMKATKLDTYINFKANLHLTSTSKTSSASIEAASKLYPLTFIVTSTDPLLQELYTDFCQFYESNSLAIAFDYESSRIPSHRQANVWLVPPRSLHFVTDTTARNILKWTHAPNSDQWWGIMWIKSHAYKTMRQSIETARRKFESELDVPSDEETDEAATTANNSASTPTPGAAAAEDSSTPASTSPQLLNLIRDPTSALSTVNYLSALLNKIAVPPSTVAVAQVDALMHLASTTFISQPPVLAPLPPLPSHPVNTNMWPTQHHQQVQYQQPHIVPVSYQEQRPLSSQPHHQFDIGAPSTSEWQTTQLHQPTTTATAISHTSNLVSFR